MPNPTITLRGYIGQHTSKGTTKAGKPFLRFSCATSEWNKETQKSEYTYWNCTLFGESANRAERSIEEGANKVVLNGIIMQRTYKDKNGNEKATHDIFVNDYEMYTVATRQQGNRPQSAREVREVMNKSLTTHESIRY